MDNQELSKLLNIYAKLYDLHGGNPFKLKSISATAFNLKKVPEPLMAMSDEALSKVSVVGKMVLPKLLELKQTGSIDELEELYAKTPKGLLEVLQIKGLGSKKVEILWKEMGIESVSDLLDAIRENRLKDAKGFGLKTQEAILKDIEFKFSQEGKLHWAKVEVIALALIEKIKSLKEVSFVSETGAYRRLDEVIDQLELVVVCSQQDILISALQSDSLICQETKNNVLIFQYLEVFKIVIHIATSETAIQTLFETTATSEHLSLIQYSADKTKDQTSETVIYQQLNLPYILPELREGLYELKHLDKQDQLITYKDLKGVIHNHTTYSDGVDTLADMATYAKTCGFEYLVVCDHSQTAFYANGLKEERCREQFKEIEQLNLKHKDFKIFKGIESDVLSDGSLDYSDDFLKEFDVIVASVHSQLSMDMDKAHLRLINAIENPYTRILGHPTGRLLLMRKGYEIDYAYILDACVANNVLVELNAHPYRLDIDWRWIDYLINKGGMISINPDAHHKAGYHDMRYGVNVARKGYLTPEHCLNAMDLPMFEKWLEKK
ncbi:MAG: PHP domain-containing protein [Bacteroidota bacterium]|nr:PHP domain-containing protein [Bacteroidota bacterium]